MGAAGCGGVRWGAVKNGEIRWCVPEVVSGERWPLCEAEEAEYIVVGLGWAGFTGWVGFPGALERSIITALAFCFVLRVV